MARKLYVINAPEDLEDLTKQLNIILTEIRIQLQRIEGLDGYSSEFFGPIKHTGTTVGFYSATPVVKADAIPNPAESIAANNTAIDSILVALRNLGVIAT